MILKYLYGSIAAVFLLQSILYFASYHHPFLFHHALHRFYRNDASELSPLVLSKTAIYQRHFNAEPPHNHLQIRQRLLQHQQKISSLSRGSISRHLNLANTVPTSFKPSAGYTVGQEFSTKYKYQLLSSNDYVNKFCLSNSSPTCFSVLSSANAGVLFSAQGEVITLHDKKVHELGGGCCEFDWKRHHTQHIRLGKSLSSWSVPTHCKIMLNLCQHHAVTYHRVMYEVMSRFLYSMPLMDAFRNDMCIAISKTDIMFAILTEVFQVNPSRIVQLDTSNHKKTVPWRYINAYNNGLIIFPPPLIQRRHLFAKDHSHKTASIIKSLIASTNISVNISVSTAANNNINSNSSSTKTNTNSKLIMILIERASNRKASSEDQQSCTEQRCISNFQQLHDSLVSSIGSRFDIHIFTPSTSFKQSVSLFASAQVVVGVHGAGLQNSMFCMPATTVVEIGIPGASYQAEAESFGHHHHRVVVDGLEHGSQNFELRNIQEIVTKVQVAVENDRVVERFRSEHEENNGG